MKKATSAGSVTSRRISSHRAAVGLGESTGISHFFRTRSHDQYYVARDEQLQRRHLPPTVEVGLSLTKLDGTDTYCWKPEEIQAIVAHCRADGALDWLGDVVVALASTGLRISELASMRWSDVDLTVNVIHLTDETARAPRKAAGKRRETKNSRSRSFPISAELRVVLVKLKPSDDGSIFHGPRGGNPEWPWRLRSVCIRNLLAPGSTLVEQA